MLKPDDNTFEICHFYERWEFMKSLTFSTLALSLSAVCFTSSSFAQTEYKALPSAYADLKAAPKSGTFNQRLGNNPKVLNPLLSADSVSSAAEGFLWATLFTEDAETLNPLPYLAKTYKISADRKTYTFTLNEKAKWSDGTPVTTDDVKFTFDTQMDPKTEAAAIRTYWEGTSIKVVDKLSFEFSVKEPKFDTLRSLYLFAPIQKKQFASEPDFNKAKGVMSPIGNGPYIFKSFDRDQQVVLERDKNWWGSELAHNKNRFNADKIVMRIITDDALQYERFLKGDLDVLEFNAEQFGLKVRGTDKARFGASNTDKQAVWATEVKNKAPRGYSYLAWNLKNPIFGSVKTRQALARIIDYKQIIDSVYQGYAYQCTSPFGSLTLNAAEELRAAGKMLTTDRKAALALLKEDGWKDSDGDNVLDKTVDGKLVKFSFELKFNSNNPLRAKIAQIARENFKAAGIEMKVQSMEWNAFLDDVDNRRFDAIILGWTATPYPNPKQTWHSTSEANQGSNFVSYKNEKVDALIDQANVEFDPKKRVEMMKEINRLIYNDQPYLFLLEPSSMLAGFNKKVGSPSNIWAMAYDVSPPTDTYSFAP
jgi:peptide/nickel transport system substrate-binding protein/microcin C transport system substrate-binding protein